MRGGETGGSGSTPSRGLEQTKNIHRGEIPKGDGEGGERSGKTLFLTMPRLKTKQWWAGGRARGKQRGERRRPPRKAR